MIRRRRAVFLVEMLTVLLLMAVGGTLMAVGLASIQRSHKRVTAFSNRYSLLNDFLRCVSRDVRMSTTASLRDGDGEGLRQVLVIGEIPEQVTYRFYDRRVERTGFEGDSIAGKRWAPIPAAVKIAGDRARTGGAVVSVTVTWDRADTDGLESNRRFDASVRCGGELSDDRD